MSLNESQSYILKQHGVFSEDIEHFNDDNNSMEITYKDGSKRTVCSIITRTMGYHRPVSDWNIGKKSEFATRKYFKIDEQDYKLKQSAE